MLRAFHGGLRREGRLERALQGHRLLLGALGGGADLLGLLVAAELSEAFNQRFFVENRPGNSGSIGSALVARAEPDGHTLLMALSSMIFLPDAERLRVRLTESLGEAGSYEDFLDRVRLFGQEHMFLIGTRVLSGTVSARQAGEAFANLVAGNFIGTDKTGSHALGGYGISLTGTGTTVGGTVSAARNVISGNWGAGFFIFGGSGMTIAGNDIGAHTVLGERFRGGGTDRGDTTSAERERMRRRPPHILVTTPESLYVLLGSASGRKTLATARTVIIDEIHAMPPNKRGAGARRSVRPPMSTRWAPFSTNALPAGRPSRGRRWSRRSTWCGGRSRSRRRGGGPTCRRTWTRSA